MQLIKTDKEFLVVFRVLLDNLKKKLTKKEYVVFPPENVNLPPKGEIKAKRNFKFTPVVRTEIDTKEALRQLGVTLYHLRSGKSEHNRESYILDGYKKPLNSALWPVVSSLLAGEVDDPDEIKKMLNDSDLLENVKNGKVDHEESEQGNPSEAMAILERIAGELPVFMPEPVAAKWGVAVPAEVTLRYSEQTLQECIEANKQGEDWRLVYFLGLSLREQREKRGTDTDSQPCFYSGNTWWLKDKEDSWAKHKPEPGFYLINFKGQFGDKNWQDQESGITALGERFERCDETVFAESIQTVFMLMDERIAENWWHWGVSVDSDGYRVSVGHFDSGGLGVDGESPGGSDSILRVCVARKFDS